MCYPGRVLHLHVAITCECVRYGADRDAPEGSRRILGADTTVVVKTEDPCRCGDDRVRLRVAIGAPHGD